MPKENEKIAPEAIEYLNRILNDAKNRHLMPKENEKTVREIIDYLNKFPENARCRAYEGEVKAIFIFDEDDNELGYIETAGF